MKLSGYFSSYFNDTLPVVELKQIRYYDNEIPTISREIYDNKVNGFCRNRNVVIKRKYYNFWGSKRWILKINENITGERSRVRFLFLHILVILFVVVIAGFALYYSLIGKTWTIKQHHDQNPNRTPPKTTSETGHRIIITTVPLTTTTTTPAINYCRNCALNGTTASLICLKLSETAKPRCLVPRDKKDPTGCGGYCSLNTQFCQLLKSSPTVRVFQCSNLKNVLKCPPNYFNCGNMCINGTKQCDGVVHCSNKADEINCECNLTLNFRCKYYSSLCLPKSKRCDGIVDCWDKSDETDCYHSTNHENRQCANDSIPCLATGQCIPRQQFCDGVQHCADKSDEPQGCQL